MSEPTSVIELIHALCAEQRKRWQEGDRVSADHYLEQHWTLRDAPEQAVELIYNEVLLREQAGETPRLEEYLRRYPQFGEQLHRLFEVHLVLDASELQRTDHSAVVADPGGIGPRAAGDERPVVPGYEVLEPLGKGGMGVVWKARQLKLNRVVALKMLRGGDATAEELARFRGEAEAQARLQHPNIAQIFEVGEVRGRPYFALEHVEGGTLAEALKGTPQPARRVAELLRTLAIAVQHAHECGLVHRDLKPGNVLLASGGCKPPVAALVTGGSHPPLAEVVPKISDFGLAKRLQETSGQTRTGEILGTPSYMAPEQAQGKVHDLGPACDVHALGAILYECLTGRPPFLGETPLDTLLQVRRQDPVPPRRLQPKVPRDLETICLKCLQKDRGRRYASAQALADDLGRFLDGRPILARPVGRVERLWRWSRRNPAVAALTAAVLLLVALAGGGGLIFAHRHGETAVRAQSALEKARRLQEDGKRAEAEAAVEQAEALLLDRWGHAALREQVREARDDLAMATTIEEIRFSQVETKKGRRIGDWPRANQHYAEAFQQYGVPIDDLSAKEAAVRIRPRAIALELALALDEWALAQEKLPKPESEGWPHLFEVARRVDGDEWRNRVREAMLAEDTKRFHALAGEARNKELPAPTWLFLARVLMVSGDLPGSVALSRLAQQQHPGDFWANFQLAYGSQMLLKPPRNDDAIRFFTAARALRPNTPPHNLGNLLHETGRPAEAVPMFQAALRRSPDDAWLHNNLSLAYLALGRGDDALASVREAVRLDPNLAEVQCNLGSFLAWKGAHQEGVDAIARALRLKPDFAQAHNAHGYVLLEMGRFDDAIPSLNKAIALKPDLPEAHFYLGYALQNKGRAKEALAAYRQAIQHKPDYLQAHDNLAQLLRQEGQFPEALDAFRRWHEIGSRTPDWSKIDSARIVQHCQRLLDLDGRLSAILRGEGEPTDAAGWLAVAEVCVIRKRHDAAVRAYAKAFAVSPEQLAEHGYNAGCAAALAGCGQGDDAPGDEKERSRLRAKAREWLGDQLRRCVKRMADNPAKERGAVAQSLQRCQQDADLAGLRQTDALEKLPEAERKDWQAFWRDVEALKQRALRSP